MDLVFPAEHGSLTAEGLPVAESDAQLAHTRPEPSVFMPAFPVGWLMECQFDTRDSLRSEPFQRTQARAWRVQLALPRLPETNLRSTQHRLSGKRLRAQNPLGVRYRQLPGFVEQRLIRAVEPEQNLEFAVSAESGHQELQGSLGWLQLAPLLKQARRRRAPGPVIFIFLTMMTYWPCAHGMFFVKSSSLFLLHLVLAERTQN
jgi:hypothetical protein